MTQHKDETAIEYMRRIVNNVSYEQESFLEDLPNIEAIVEYFELWSVYDTDLCAGIIEAIESGADPIPYNRFVGAYNLPWLVYRRGKWVERNRKAA